MATTSGVSPGLVLAVGAMAAAAFALGWVATLIAAWVGRRAGAMDSAGVAGQVKVRRPVPNIGGIGIVVGFLLPMAAGLALAWGVPREAWFHGGGADMGLGGSLGGWLGGLLSEVGAQIAGVREQTASALVLLAGVVVLHVLGLIDDRRPMGPWLKLAVMAAVSAAVLWGTQTRLLTLLDGWGLVGVAASWGLTLAWVLVVTNAMNFLDNMDALSGGVAAIAGGCLVAAAVVSGQWFVGLTLAALAGSALGFLMVNRPPARVFMGDGGSLVLGFVLAVMSVRITYVGAGVGAGLPDGGLDPVSGSVPGSRLGPGPWFAVFMPVVVLAVPIYDFVSVVVLRLRQGKSPMVGDQQHLSHRLVARGLSRPRAVAVVHAFTGATALGGVFLLTGSGWAAVVVAAQVALLLLALAALEFGGTPTTRREDGAA